jgi:zinc finger BED domain-containing protein 5/7/8/9
LFDLRQEVKLFFQQQNNSRLQYLLSSDDWLAKLANLADIFSLLNELKTSLQRQPTDVFTLRGKIDAFQKKRLLWQMRLAEEDMQMFPNFDDYMKQEDVNRQVINNSCSTALTVTH